MVGGVTVTAWHEKLRFLQIDHHPEYGNKPKFFDGITQGVIADQRTIRFRSTKDLATTKLSEQRLGTFEKQVDSDERIFGVPTSWPFVGNCQDRIVAFMVASVCKTQNETRLWVERTGPVTNHCIVVKSSQRQPPKQEVPDMFHLLSLQEFTA